MNGPELLEHAAGVVTRRRREYGEPVDVFEAIAKRWSSVFRTEVSAAQVVIALLDVKLVRLTRNPKHLDSQVDMPAMPLACARSRSDWPSRLPLIPRSLAGVRPAARVGAGRDAASSVAPAGRDPAPARGYPR
jgi:hypothetical protein